MTDQDYDPATDCVRHGCGHRGGQVHRCVDGERRTIAGTLVADREQAIEWLRDIVNTVCQDSPYAQAALDALGD